MAIQGSFNLANALDSQAYAYKCWYNYNYGNNTMGISAQDMGEITQTWNSELGNWQATALDDENAYEIEDDDFSTAQQNGRNQAQDSAGGYDGKQGGQITRTVVDSAAGLAGALGTTIGSGVANTLGKAVAGKLVENTAAKVGAKAAEKVAGKAAEEAVKNGVANTAATEAGKQAADNITSKSVGWIITAPLALATGTAYTAKKPNKTEKEACDAMQDEMINSQNALYAAQDDMGTMGEEIVALSDEAQVYNEDANETIEETKSEYDSYKASYDALMEKIEAGEPLTDSEKELLEELIPLMQELGVVLTDTQEETTEVSEEIYDEMGTYQDGYDNAASTVAEVQGVTDYAESFDESTRTMCYVEAGAQTLNAASGAKAAFDAGKFAASGGLITAWAWGFAGMGAAGAAMSGVGATQQFKWAGEVGTEIDMRKMTQDINSTTSDIYDESIEGYEGAMSIVEDMELEMPEDMENPEEAMEAFSEESSEALASATVEGEGAGTGTGTGLGAGIPVNNGTGTNGAAARSTGTGLGAGIPVNNGAGNNPRAAGGAGVQPNNNNENNSAGTNPPLNNGVQNNTENNGVQDGDNNANPFDKDKEEKY